GKLLVLADGRGLVGHHVEQARQIQRHRQAIDSLWDEEKGYWIVTYRGTERDDVLTSSIIYPIFCDLCRDPAKIKRVIEEHMLNSKEFNGPFPIPTVAYDDPRYYHQKPPFQNEAGGLWRGNIWMPETWIIVKGLFKYGYEDEAKSMVARLLNMMANQSASVGQYQQFAHSPAEWYDSRTGLGQNNRAFSWSSAVAMDYLLGNYQNERVLGSNPDRDRAIAGHVREIFDFNSGNSLFKVETIKTVFPVLTMKITRRLCSIGKPSVVFMVSTGKTVLLGQPSPSDSKKANGRWKLPLRAVPCERIRTAGIGCRWALNWLWSLAVGPLIEMQGSSLASSCNDDLSPPPRMNWKTKSITRRWPLTSAQIQQATFGVHVFANSIVIGPSPFP
ncbi:MAG: MGH1-like glycoside hydrolase domain-containing protein, partial [Limisphaerales bacterium]